MAKYIFKRILTAIPLIIVITIYRDKNEYFR